MEFLEFQWLYEDTSLKEALQKTLGCSGQLIKKHFSSKQQNHLIQARQLSRLPLEFVNHLLINPEFSGPPPVIIKETEDYLALHKPAGLHCHPLSYLDQNTILNFLVQENKWDVLEVNKMNYDRGLLYRLDLETSGILILAKNQTTFTEIRNNFNKKMKRKIYWAVVEGDFCKEGSWTHHFVSSGSKGSKQKVFLEQKMDSQEGTMKVEKVLYSEGKSLLMVSLMTGLRHQIRAQLSFLGYPLLGDELYGGKKAERLFLHALLYQSDDIFEDPYADLFDSCFDLNSALQVTHDMLRIL